jgi:hypothetical protein
MWTPSIVPNGDNQDVYLVADDFGQHGRAWCEADIEATDLETVTQRLLEGQYNNPGRVVSFNTAENGHKTFRKKSHTNYAAAAIFRCANCPKASKALSKGMRATIGS